MIKLQFTEESEAYNTCGVYLYDVSNREGGFISNNPVFFLESGTPDRFENNLVEASQES